MDDLATLLECPKCRSKMELRANQLNCQQCQLDYPNLNAIPWLFKDPDSHLIQWQAKTTNILHYYNDRIADIDTDLNSPDLLDPTKERLKLMKTGYQKNIESIQSLMDPVLSYGPNNSELSKQLNEKIPSHQTLDTYYSNVFRDWSWDNGENAAALSVVERLLPSDLGTLLVLGAGSCRLPVDIHIKYSPEKTICLDINPLLLLSAQSVVADQPIELFEFPIAPLRKDSFAVEQTLSSSIKQPKNLFFLFADAMNLPFAAKSVDTILTPWLIDILPQNLTDFAKGINRALKPGQNWVNFGPLGFDHRQPSRCYSLEEVEAIVADSGFEIERTDYESIPYLQSPHSGHGRVEKVFGFRAKKTAEVKQPKYYEYLPHWLSHHDEPIPATDEIADIRFKSQVHFEILTAVDGKRSINEVTGLMAQHYKMTPEMAKESLVSFLTNIYERSIRK